MAVKFDPILSAVREADTGTPGADGADGLGVPAGGTTDQVLAKIDGIDFNTQWVDQSGGGGAVDSVNGQTGVVVLDASDVGAEPAKGSDDNFVTDAEKANLHAPGSDNQDLSSYLTSATAASTYQPLKGADDNYVTNAQLVVIGNTSGTNTGDNATNSLYSGLAASKEDTGVAAGLISTHNSTYDHTLLHAPGSDDQDLSGLVPYTGATGDVTLGTNRKLTAGVVHGNNSTSSSPGIIVEGGRANMLYKTTGATGGVAFNIIKATVANTDPVEAQFGVVGFLGNANVGGTPSVSYMYFDASPTGTYNQAALKLGADGKVGIGLASSTVPANALSVNTTASDTIPALGANGAKFALLNNNTYGLLSGVLSNGYVFMQAQRIDSTATAYDILLNPSGGRIGIGTTAPDRMLEINTGAATQGMRISYNDANGTAAAYADFLLASTGVMAISATGGTQINTKVGFFGTAPIVKGTAFTQTYATASHTHAAVTQLAAPAGGTGTAAGGWNTAGNRDLAITSINAARNDIANIKQVLNGLIDDLQALGLIA